MVGEEGVSGRVFSVVSLLLLFLLVFFPRSFEKG